MGEIIAEDVQRTVNRIITARDVLNGTIKLTDKEIDAALREDPIEVVDTPTQEAAGADIVKSSNIKLGVILVLAILGIALFFIFRRK